MSITDDGFVWLPAEGGSPVFRSQDEMPPAIDDNYQEPLLCEICRLYACACAQSVADIDAWADAYLGSEQCALDYFQARTTAQKFLASLHPGWMERPHSPTYLEEQEPPLHGDDAC